MFKLIKFLKPFIFPLLLAVALLYVQAMTDLALPDYMANIVDTGISQGGLEHAVPEVVRSSDFEKLKLFLEEEQLQLVKDSYRLTVTTDPAYASYGEQYDGLGGEDIYILNELSNEQLEMLDLPLAKALLTFSSINQMMADANNGKKVEINGNSIPAGMDLFATLGQIPAEQRNELMKGSTQMFESLGEPMLIQAGAKSVIEYYHDLGIDTDKIQSDYIMKIGAWMLLITLLGAAASIIVGFIAAKISGKLGRNLRRQIFTKVESFSNNELDKFSTASLITRSTNDITQIQSLMVMMIRMVFYAPIIAIGGIMRATSKSNSMSWIIALAVIIMVGCIFIIFALALPKFKMAQKLLDKLNMVTRENLSGMMVIRAFNTQRFEEDRFDQANHTLTDNNLFIGKVMSILFPVIMFVMNGVTLLIVWVGAHEIANANMQVGDMMAFMQYALLIIFSFLMLSMMFIMIPRAAVSAARIAEVLETKPVIVDPVSPKQFAQKIKGVVEFQNVSFRYPEAIEDMLKNISFTAEAGKVTAIIGPTGSGKTTLVNLIPRFYDVTSGKVLIDGMDVREATQHDVRERVGYVPQKAVLFSGTIESNLKYADENASKELMNFASEVSQSTEFINEKSEGTASEVSQGGTNLSGGQKQRLSIARALVKKPKVFIFDDSFSALDFKTDAALRKALKEKTEGSTIIIVAQRISTIKNADQILVLEDGALVGKGTHQELMESCETYQEIAFSQLSKEELA